METRADFLLTAKRDASAAKRFFRKTLQATPTFQEPRVINVDKNAAYPKAIDELKAEKELSFECGTTTEQVSQ